MLLDQAMNIMEKLVNEIKETDSEKRDHFLKSAVSIFEIATDAMRSSPEFREGFARVHSEFLNYPESRETMEQSIKAYKKLFH